MIGGKTVMGAPEKPATAENVARWFPGANAPWASACWCDDADSSVGWRSQPRRRLAHPGDDHNGIGEEMAGHAQQTRDEWLPPE